VTRIAEAKIVEDWELERGWQAYHSTELKWETTDEIIYHQENVYRGRYCLKFTPSATYSYIRRGTTYTVSGKKISGNKNWTTWKKALLLIRAVSVNGHLCINPETGAHEVLGMFSTSAKDEWELFEFDISGVSTVNLSNVDHIGVLFITTGTVVYIDDIVLLGSEDFTFSPDIERWDIDLDLRIAQSDIPEAYGGTSQFLGAKGRAFSVEGKLTGDDALELFRGIELLGRKNEVLYFMQPETFTYIPCIMKSISVTPLEGKKHYEYSIDFLEYTELNDSE